tara:strand:- start:3205 stop:3483 length:279 start_codon:yes stop_codon:yes gene_type:complete
MEKRGVKAIEQYPTPVIRNPTAAERSMLNVTQHIWSYGDRYYKLADQYYNDPKLWWVIAWYNGYPTEVQVFPGDVITVPTNIEAVMTLLGVY